MITLKIQAKTDKLPELLNIMRQYSSACRYAYNRAIENKSEKEIRPLLKKFNIGCWLQQCAIKDAIAVKTSRDELEEPYNIVFGGKENFYKRSQGKITKAEWKICRLRPIEIQGEAKQKSNRLFNFDLTNQKLTFKYDRQTHINFELFGIGNRQKHLNWLQSQIGIIPIQVKIMYDGKLWLLISFEDTRTVDIYQPIKDRILGIDMNPNYIGICIAQNGEIIHSYQYDIKQVEGEKQKYELTKITQDIVNKAKHYLVEQIAIEKLDIKTKDHGKGKRFNRLVNNKWDRNHFINQLEKRCKNELIKIRKLPAAFSSIIGNLITELPDCQASAYEMARRATCSHYPSLQLIINPWKKEYFINCNDWRDVADEIKKSGLKYRNFLSDEFTSKFRFMSINSNVITSYVTI